MRKMLWTGSVAGALVLSCVALAADKPDRAAASSTQPAATQAATSKTATVQGYPVPAYRLSEAETINTHHEEIDPTWTKTEVFEGVGEKSRVLTYTRGGADHKVAIEGYYPDGKTLHYRALYDGDASGQKNVNQGISRVWHPNGRPASVTPYTAGLKDGRCLKWATDGTPLADYTMVKGVGVEVEFYPTGKLRLVHSWDEGGYNGLVMECHVNGRIKSIANAVHGKVQGPFIAYYDIGKVENFCYFVDGSFYGPYVHYLTNGNVDSSTIMLNNTPTDLETYNAARKDDPRLIEIPSTDAELKNLPEEYRPKQ